MFGPLRSDGSHEGQIGRLNSSEAVAKDTQIKANPEGDYQAQVDLGEMALMVVRQGG